MTKYSINFFSTSRRWFKLFNGKYIFGAREDHSPGDFLQELAGVGGVEFDSEVKRKRFFS